MKTGHIQYAPFFLNGQNTRDTRDKMNTHLLQAARRRVPNLSVLINMISMRVRHLIKGQRPLIKPDNNDEELENIALREVAEGKLVAEIDFTQAASRE